jgi:hypothetical protein
MTRYLLAAEADKIQDLLFRSARLREVVGGSQLLTRFCEETPRLLMPNLPDDDLIINDGGSFRILFDSPEQAEGFGADLAEVYRRATGSSLTVAEPVKVDSRFEEAGEQAEEALRRAKRRRENWHSQEHAPHVAFCASCGMGLAVTYHPYHEDEEVRYRCRSCLNKGAERAEQRAGNADSFLGQFYHGVVETGDYDWPGKRRRRVRKEADPLEDVADYDPRRYVAYLVADGNNMGKVFGACKTPEQLRALSKGLSGAVRKALAIPTQAIMCKNPNPLGDDRHRFIPVWPLILGGDDLLALIPAPWALDFAQRFCRAYEEEMLSLVERIGLSELLAPTVSAAVVICKSKHPYTLAHEAGKARLAAAKRMGKQRVLLDGGQPCSTVNFEVVLGGRLMTPPADHKVRPTLRPYWVTEAYGLDGWGLPVQQLIEQRYQLRDVPHKRLAELCNLYDDLPATIRSDDLDPWQIQLDQLLKRIGRNETHKKAVDAALVTLGSASTHWRKVDRYPADPWYGHGLPDLLEAWDFALNLDKKRQDYEEEAG